MFFSTSLVIPAQTTPALPARKVLRVAEGTVWHVWVRWKWGSACLCGARMKYQEFQYWPMSPNEWFPSDVLGLDFDEKLVIGEAPFELSIEGYNRDDSYSHEVWVAWDIIREDPLAGRRGFIRRLMGV